MKKSSPYVTNKRLRFDERQLQYIARSRADAVKAGYMKVHELLVAEVPPKAVRDIDKAYLYLPDHMYTVYREPWDIVQV